MLVFNTTDHHWGQGCFLTQTLCIPLQKFRELALLFCNCPPGLVCPSSFELLCEVFPVTGVFATCLSLVLSLPLSKAEVPSAVLVCLEKSSCSLRLCLLLRVTDTSGFL